MLVTAPHLLDELQVTVTGSPGSTVLGETDTELSRLAAQSPTGSDVGSPPAVGIGGNAGRAGFVVNTALAADAPASWTAAVAPAAVTRTPTSNARSFFG
jgi:hypothetical protein